MKYTRMIAAFLLFSTSLASAAPTGWAKRHQAPARRGANVRRKPACPHWITYEYLRQKYFARTCE